MSRQELCIVLHNIKSEKHDDGEYRVVLIAYKKSEKIITDIYLVEERQVVKLVQ